ncbi:hypothetical protein MERGE_002226 [Pneumocystis wakefieldiae]|uniref:WD repeat domain-containing protein 83 n=1 Tax=Pneumocystis wakefieldiae TaxID=38082 RepID=A0A899FY31_9ASCO|nr:hypothetical protein MERGE_002226 [Pneumocystis wakefieldiae]
MLTFPTQKVRVLSPEGNFPANIIIYNSKGQYALTGSHDRFVRLWNPHKGGLIQEYRAHGYEVLDITVSYDSTRFASSGGDKQVFLWDVTAGRTIQRFSGHFSRVNSVSFNVEATVLASGSYDSSVRLWDCRSSSHTPIQVLEDGKDSISSVLIANHEIITGSIDGRVRTYDLRKGQLYTDVIGQPVTSVEQSSDANCLLISTLDSTIRLFDKCNGGLLQTFKGHVNSEYRVKSCFGQSDKVVISGSEDGRICVWDLLEGKLIHQLRFAPENSQRSCVSCVAFHPKKNQMLSCGVNGEITVWEIP